MHRFRLLEHLNKEKNAGSDMQSNPVHFTSISLKRFALRYFTSSIFFTSVKLPACILQK